MRKRKDSYLIPFSRFEWFEKGMKKITNKAKKLGIEDVPTFSVLGKEVHKRKMCFEYDDKGVCVRGESVEINFYRVVIAGTQPIVNGYEFLGTVEHKSAGNILKLREGLEETLDLTPYRQGKQKCEHCGQRRYRKDTYLVHSPEDNKVVQVGRTCLKDFMGHKSPEFFAHYAQFLIECEAVDEEKEYHGFGRTDMSVRTQNFLEVVYAIMIKDGCYKNKSYEGGSTSSQAWSYHFQDTRGMKQSEVDAYRAWCKEIEYSSELPENKAKAMEAIKYYQNLENPNNFDHNLKVIATEEYIEPKNFGLGAYVMQGYFNFEAKENAKAEKAKKIAEANANKKNEYLGTIDKRETFTNMRYVKTGSYEHTYGTTYFHTFEDSEGRKMIIKNSYNVASLILQFNSELYDSEVRGKDTLNNYLYTFKATVKKHEISSYSKRKETTANRVKIEKLEKINESENQQITA